LVLFRCRRQHGLLSLALSRVGATLSRRSFSANAFAKPSQNAPFAAAFRCLLSRTICFHQQHSSLVSLCLSLFSHFIAYLSYLCTTYWHTSTFTPAAHFCLHLFHLPLHSYTTTACTFSLSITHSPSRFAPSLYWFCRPSLGSSPLYASPLSSHHLYLLVAAG